MNISDLPAYVRVAIGAMACGFFAVFLACLSIIASMIPEDHDEN